MTGKWILDSGCSRHMTGDISLFSDFVANKKGYISYGDHKKGFILGKGSICNTSSITISNVMLVEGLRHNLLSTSQSCDNGYKVTFAKDCCIIEHNEKNDCMFKGVRVSNIYMLDLREISLNITQCLVTLSEDSWLYHRRLAHFNFDLLNKIVTKDLVISLPKMNFSKDHLCDACQNGKQTRVSFKSKKKMLFQHQDHLSFFT